MAKMKTLMKRKKMKVYVIVGVYRGCIQDVEVFSTEPEAKRFKLRIDENYGSRKEENDSVLFIKELN